MFVISGDANDVIALYFWINLYCLSTWKYSKCTKFFTYHLIFPSNDQAIEEREMLIVFKIPTLHLYFLSFQQRVRVREVDLGTHLPVDQVTIYMDLLTIEWQSKKPPDVHFLYVEFFINDFHFNPLAECDPFHLSASQMPAHPINKIQYVFFYCY